MKMKNKLCVFLSITIIIILGLTISVSCNNNADQGEADFSRYFEDRELFQGETLTISTFWPLTSTRHRSIDEHARRYMTANPGVNIEVSYPGRDVAGWVNPQRYHEQLSIQILAGTAPVLIDTGGNLFSWADPRVNRMFADWFSVMYQDPDFNEEDFYMNALNALASRSNGRLVIYPLGFEYTPIFVNSTVPGLAESMEGRNTVTMTDLHQAYHDFAPDTHFSLITDYNLRFAVMGNIENFLDIENRTVNFNNQEFIQFITEARNIGTNQHSTEFRGGFWGAWVSREEQEILSRLFLFYSGSPLSNHQMVNITRELPFVNILPLANDNGEIQISTDLAFALNAGATPAQQALAWDFIKSMQSTELPENFVPTQGIPVYRPFLPNAVDFWLNHHGSAFTSFLIYNDFGLESGMMAGMRQATEDIIAELDRTANMPMTAKWWWDWFGTMMPGNAIDSIIFETLDNFQDGLITAQVAAETLQNSITLILMEME